MSEGRRPVIVADDAIAAVHEAFSPLGEVRTMPGRAIDRAALASADALVVRTITRVDADLVSGTPVRFVGSATAGLDHVDVAGVRALGIEVAHAPGCNAVAVAEVVLSSLATLHLRGLGSFPPDGAVGIVGFGAIGRRLAARLRALNVHVIACDPPLAERRVAEDEIDAGLAATIATERFVALADLLAACSVVTLHVPLVTGGPHATRHLLDAAGLERLPHGAIVINTCRGGVLDDAALLAWLERGRGTAVLDVWEHEPLPAPPLVDAVALAMPHVAGYSLEGKLEATRRIHDALARHLGATRAFDVAPHLPAPRHRTIAAPSLAAALAKAIDVAGEDDALRHALARAGHDPAARGAAYERLRRDHPLRRELSSFRAAPSCPAGVRTSLEHLGVRLAHD